MSYESALIYASGTIFLIACNALLSNVDLFTAMRNAMKVRVAICSIIYRKVSEFLKDFFFTQLHIIIDQT